MGVESQNGLFILAGNAEGLGKCFTLALTVKG